MKRALLIIISGPSGVGKSSIAHAVVDRLDGVFSVSMTTRQKTAQDREGVDYHFVDEPAFRRAADAGDLLEWAEVFGNLYGTPRRAVADHLASGRDVILEIDVAGGRQVKAAVPQALAVFIEPPSEPALLERLRRRARDDEPTIQRRFSEAQREIREARACGAYDAFVVNERLDEAIEAVVGLIEERRHRD